MEPLTYYGTEIIVPQMLSLEVAGTQDSSLWVCTVLFLPQLRPLPRSVHYIEYDDQ